MTEHHGGRRVLTIAHAFPPAAAVGAIRVAKFVKYIRALGWDVRVVTPRRHSYGLDTSLCGDTQGSEVVETGSAETAALFNRLRSWRTLHPRTASGFVARLLAYVLDGIAVPDHASGWIPFGVLAALRVHRKTRCDLVWSTGNPWSALVVAGCVASITRLPLVLDFQDPWTTAPNWHPRPLNRWVSRRLEGWLVGRAEAIVVVNWQMRDALGALYGEGLIAKIKVVRNGFDAEDFSQYSGVADTGLRLAHVGKFTTYRRPEGLWDLLRALSPDERTQVKLVLVGGAGVEPPEDVAAMVEVTGWQDRREALRHMGAADALVTINGEYDPAIVPTKLPEYMAVHRPVIVLGTRDSATAQLVEERGAGVTIEPGETRVFVDFVRASLAAKAEGRGIWPSYDAPDEYTWRHLMDAYAEALAEALRSSESRRVVR